MFKRSIFCACLLIAFPGAGFAQEPTVEFEGRYWITDLDAEVKAVSSGVGEKFDLKSDLGIDDEDFPEGRFYWHTGPNSKIRLSYTQADFDGDQNATQTIQFEGQTFTVGTRVISGLDIKYFGIGWIWQFLNLSEDKIKIGSIVEVKGLSAEVSLDAPTLGVSESEEFFGGLPTVGLALDISPIDKIKLFAEVSGIGAGDLGYFFDTEAGIKIMPFKHFSIIAGYRAIGIKAEDDPDFVKFDLNGPFFGATLKF
ncbi:MAG: hypothetical protein AB1481_06180 [Candidatus Omnitrophota bacterium]